MFDYRLETEEDLVESILTLYGCDNWMLKRIRQKYYETTVELIQDGYVVAEEIEYNDFDTQGIESL